MIKRSILVPWALLLIGLLSSVSADTDGSRAEGEKNALRVLPDSRLFTPILADPRWPHFFASYQYYMDDDELKQVGAVGFGESFSLLRQEHEFFGYLELGLEPGVFSIFDLAAPSMDLVNADYRVALSLSHRKGPVSSLVQVYHQSSHLGDEFILRDRVEKRINLSYESLYFLTSLDLLQSLRIYGGGGYIFRIEPAGIDPWSWQLGFESSPPLLLAGGQLRPAFATDIQSSQESDWKLDVSVRAGFQIEDEFADKRSLFIFVEYYNGMSPNGQFFDRAIQSLGIGLHLFLF